MSRLVKEALLYTTRSLQAVALEEAALEARLMLCHVLALEQASSLVMHLERTLTDDEDQRLRQLIQERTTGKPIQYILKTWGFMGLTFHVASGVLIPRQDTETLCEHALALAKQRHYQSALDLCCGSGCIGISLAHYGKLDVCASDVSDACLSLAARNADFHNVPLQLVKSDLFEQVTGTFDLIVSNPPYLNDSDMACLQKEVRFEPALALYGGTDGLDFYRAIARDYKRHLRSGGALIMEVGIDQAERVKELFVNAYTVNDVNGTMRVVCVPN